MGASAQFRRGDINTDYVRWIVDRCARTRAVLDSRDIGECHTEYSAAIYEQEEVELILEIESVINYLKTYRTFSPHAVDRLEIKYFKFGVVTTTAGVPYSFTIFNKQVCSGVGKGYCKFKGVLNKDGTISRGIYQKQCNLFYIQQVEIRHQPIDYFQQKRPMRKLK